MPQTAYYPDDNTLMLIFREDENDLVLETAYSIYRIPFVSFFTSYFDLNTGDAEDLFQRTLTTVFTEIRTRAIKSPCMTTLFKIVLAIGYNLFVEKKEESQIVFDKKIKRLKRVYLEADIMIILIDGGDEIAFELVHFSFREPTFRVIQKRFGVAVEQLDFDPEEYYQRATGKLKEKIRQKAPNSPKVPMKAMLFTYFFKIAYWEFKNFSKKSEKVEHPTEEWQWEKIVGTEQEEVQYIDFLLKKWKKLNKYQFENEKELIAELGKKLGEARTQLLKDLAEGKSYREIAGANNKSEVAVRKMAFDCRKKIREILGIKIED